MKKQKAFKVEKPWDDFHGEFVDGKFIYYSFIEDDKGEWIRDQRFSYRIIDEKYNEYTTLIYTPKYIVVLVNETNLSEEDLKQYIVDVDFKEVNDLARQHRNKKARERRARQN